MGHATNIAVLAAALAVTTLSGGLVAGQQGTYALEQGEFCTELAPLSYQDASIEEFYGYTANASDPGVQYSANTPLGIEEQNDDTSSLFLYEGPDGLSLVVLHDAVNGTGGGAATLTFAGLPSAGEWVVKDDPENESVEQWNRTTDEGVAVDWGWRGAWTDGGAFQGGLDGDFEIQISPAFNEGAETDPITPGNVTEWRALSGEGDSFTSVDLEMDRPVTIRTGACS